MQRREFLAKGAVTVGAVAGLSGCIFGGSPNPPRRSHVFEPLTIQDGQLVVDLEEEIWIESRADVESGRLRPARSGGLSGIDLGGLSPVGVASAAKGATGRGRGGYVTAPKDRHGRARYHGDDDDDEWYDNHSDEINRYTAAVTAIGIAYLGSEIQFEDNPPGPGPVDWDKEIDDPGDRVTYPAGQEGWYRVGADLSAANANHDFGWEAIDFEMDGGAGGMDLNEQWKVSPRM